MNRYAWTKGGSKYFPILNKDISRTTLKNIKL